VKNQSENTLKNMRTACTSILMLGLSGCGAVSDQCSFDPENPGAPNYSALSTNSTILVAGDSILTQNDEKCQSVAHEVGFHFDQQAFDVSRGGSNIAETTLHFSVGDKHNVEIGTNGYIPLPAEDDWQNFEWAVISAGANDLLACDCANSSGDQDCASGIDEDNGIYENAYVNGIVEDMDVMLDDIRGRGDINIALIGNYAAGSFWENCGPQFSQLSRKYDELMKTGDVFIHTMDVDIEKSDGAHPSEKGSQTIADLVAAAIKGL